jgi:uncharacterized protein (TIGR02391 family)
MTYMGFTVSPEEALQLAVDELALRVLRDAVETETWNTGNWAVMAAGSHKGPAGHALSEAWAWLYSNGLVAPDFAKNNSLHAVFVTRLGHQVAKEGLGVVKAHQRLALDLHPLIERKVRRQYLMGEWELACLAAMREVEIRVRQLAGESDSKIGVKLMRDAFRDSGPLHDSRIDAGESVARMELFAGAIGLFKNPTSHREVVVEDPAEAAEIILLADLLMRILDRLAPF